MSILRWLLCFIGRHDFRKYGRQIWGLNMGSSAPPEYDTLYFMRCPCGKAFEMWGRDHYLNNDTRAAPCGVFEEIKEQENDTKTNRKTQRRDGVGS